MLLLISVAIFSFSLGYLISHFIWKHDYNRLYKVSLKVLKDQRREHDKITYARVRAKIDEIDNIMEEQLTIWGQADGPNRGATHSKWKGSLAGRINELETEKMNIFRDILSEGVDLTVSVVGSDGEKSKKKMSQIIKKYDLIQSESDYPDKPVAKPNKENETNNNKLKLVKESKLRIIKD